MNYTKGYLSKLETGKKRITPEMARRLDEALLSEGVLVGLLPTTERFAPVEEEADPVNTEVCPYPGWVAFGLSEARWFFGRDPAPRGVGRRLE